MALGICKLRGYHLQPDMIPQHIRLKTEQNNCENSVPLLLMGRYFWFPQIVFLLLARELGEKWI